MKKIIIGLMILLLIVSCVKIPAGYTGIKVNLLGSSKGEVEELPPGRYAAGVNTEYHRFPTFVVNYVWTKDKSEGSPNDESFSFQTKEGLIINCDIGISYQLETNEGSISGLFTEYRRGVEELTDTVIRNEVRDALNVTASKYSVEEIIGNGKGLLLNEVEEIVREYFESKNIKVLSLSWVSALRVPDNVTTALNASIEANQRAIQRQNEVAEAEAEARINYARAQGEANKIIAIAEAEAEANLKVSNSLTPQVLRMEWIKKWNGVLPEVTSDADLILEF